VHRTDLIDETRLNDEHASLYPNVYPNTHSTCKSLILLHRSITGAKRTWAKDGVRSAYDREPT
jgi:hypothetical protein